MPLVSGDGEFAAALGFMARHQAVWLDVLGFALCGAVGQVFICKPLLFYDSLHQLTASPVYAITTMGSLHLVTITVTRKMITMIVSVLWFGHRLGSKQWMGVGLVFGAIGAEAYINTAEKAAKAKAAKASVKKEL